jgi:PBSX family phage terminase large subunit
MPTPIYHKFRVATPPPPFVPFADWQVKAWKDQSTIIFLCGTTRSGKTIFALEKAHAYALRYPGSKLLFVRKTEASMFGQMLQPFEQFVLGGMLGQSVVHDGKNRAYFYANGSQILYRGICNDAQMQSIRGLTLNFIVADEVHLFSISDHEELLPRMSASNADFCQLLYLSNPDNPRSWQYQKFVKNGEASYYWSHWSHNPHLSKDYPKFLDMMTGVRRARLRDGLWVESEGSVYNFNPAVHLLKRFDIPPGWTRICSIDFGYNAPFVCQWWAIDPDGTLYLYREIYETELLITDAAKKIKQLSANEKISEYISDHDAGERAVLADHGIHTVAANKDVIVGIDAVRRRLAVGANGKPRLYILTDTLVHADPMLLYKSMPTCILDEISCYVYKNPKPGEISSDEPLKKNDHSMDAMRYLVMRVDKHYSFEYNPNKSVKSGLNSLFSPSRSGIF